MYRLWHKESAVMTIQSWGVKLFSASALLLVIILAFLFISIKVFAATTVDVKFASHIQANLPEQDVFVESKDDPTKLVRVEGEQAKDPTTLAKKVYASSQMVPHDPFKLGSNPLGPYPKGKALGFSLEQWLAATGTGTYLVDGNQAELNLTLEKLVPNGTYTVWCSRLTFPPNPKVVDRPCGAADGTENTFTSDASGNGKFDLKLPPLEESTKETASVIALAYHSDKKTHGDNPGDFGLNSHVQLFFLVPGAESAMVSASPAATAVPVQGGMSKKVWALVIGGIVIIGLAWWWFSRKPSAGSPTPEV